MFELEMSWQDRAVGRELFEDFNKYITLVMSPHYSLEPVDRKNKDDSKYNVVFIFRKENEFS